MKRIAFLTVAALLLAPLAVLHAAELKLLCFNPQRSRAPASE